MNQVLGRAVRYIATPLFELASRGYVSGPELSDALNTCQRISQEGTACTIGYWDRDEEGSQKVADTYLAALKALEKHGFDCYLSIKAPSVNCSYDLISEVVETAKETGIRLHFDSEGPGDADKTYKLVEFAAGRYSQIGCTLPGRWLRSLQDADLAVKLGVNVRVVKGEWVDPEHPEIDLREGFLSVIDRLAGRARYVAVASHDTPMAREALRRLKQAGTPCGLELLYGLPMKASLKMAHEEGVKVRVYVPFGRAWLPYALSQVRKKPRVLWWVIRDTIFSPFL